MERLIAEAGFELQSAVYTAPLYADYIAIKG
jgi:hypothetical protein